MKFSYDFFKKSADYILDKIDYKPEIAMILGSSLGGLADEIEDKVLIKYTEIPNFLTSTVEGHAGELILGTLMDKKVVCMSGRFHYYEGYDFEQLVIPIRVFSLLGVKNTILTNAAGAVNKSYKPGDIMIIKDHIKLMGASPMRGSNISEFGDRFFDVGDMYTKRLRDIAKKVATDNEIEVHEGIYYFWAGPNFESHAEIRAIRLLGADAVGMSTATEALTAAHCNMRLLGMSLITNMAAGVTDQSVTHEEVIETARLASRNLSKYIKKIISEI
jgi:purine-nucleoside phosphorylase